MYILNSDLIKSGKKKKKVDKDNRRRKQVCLLLGMPGWESGNKYLLSIERNQTITYKHYKLRNNNIIVLFKQMEKNTRGNT